MNVRTTAYLELSAAAVLIGSSVVAGKWTTMQLPVFLSQSISLAIALILLVPMVWMSRSASLSLAKKDLLYLLLQAFLGMFLFRVLLLYGLKTAPAAEAGIVTSLTPAAVAVLSFIFLKERLTTRLLIGVTCSLLGIISIQAPAWFVSAFSPHSAGSSFGLILILAAVCGEAMLTILRKMTASSVSSLVGTTYVTLFSFLMFTPFALVEANQYDFTSIHLKEFGMLLYYGVFVTALAYILWFRGVAKVSAGTCRRLYRMHPRQHAAAVVCRAERAGLGGPPCRQRLCFLRNLACVQESCCGSTLGSRQKINYHFQKQI